MPGSGKVTTELVWNIWFHLLACGVSFSFSFLFFFFLLLLPYGASTSPHRDRQTGEFGAQPSCTEWPVESDTCVVELQRLGPLVPRRGWGRKSRCTPPSLLFLSCSQFLLCSSLSHKPWGYHAPSSPSETLAGCFPLLERPLWDKVWWADSLNQNSVGVTDYDIF